MNNLKKINTGLKKILLDVFGMVGDIDGIEMDQISEWDSLKHIHILSAIDDYFGIEINFEDAIEMISVKEIIKMIDKYLQIKTNE